MYFLIMKTRSLTFILLLIFLFFHSSFSIVFADDFQDGSNEYRNKNYDEAIRLWLPLAKKGDAKAQSNLGNMYRKGQGVPQDYKEAVRLFRLSAKQGNAVAQFNLGWMYFQGQGVPQDYKEAVRLFRLSAGQGYAGAQYNLGVMYSKGMGVESDNDESLKWFKLSAKQGNNRAVEHLESLEIWNYDDSQENSEKVENDFVKERIPHKLIAIRNPKESIEIHSSHFTNCTEDKIGIFEHKDIIIYSVKAQLSCLLTPLSKTKPKSKSKTSLKFDRSVSENKLAELDSSDTNVLLLYDSLSDGGESENIYPLNEVLVKLSESGQTIVLTAPESDGGVTHIKQISSKYIVVRVFGHTWQSAYLVSTDLKEMNYITNGGVEVVNLEKLIFKSSGRKDYWKKGGAFWYNAIIDKTGKIIDVDNEGLSSEYKACFSKSDFLKKSNIKLPESSSDIICVNR